MKPITTSHATLSSHQLRAGTGVANSGAPSCQVRSGADPRAREAPRPWRRTGVSFRAMALAASLTLCPLAAQPAFALDIVGPPAPVRLDAPPTDANSIRVDFGYGVILRMPKTQGPPQAMLPAPNGLVHQQAVSMVFWYPDLTPTGWVPQVDYIIQRERNAYVPQRDRFRVNIQWLYYAPPDGNYAPG
jgi:hypothetical protein